jgi:hypothetical protein
MTTKRKWREYFVVVCKAGRYTNFDEEEECTPKAVWKGPLVWPARSMHGNFQKDNAPVVN